jgi:hypothetical protein
MKLKIFLTGLIISCFVFSSYTQTIDVIPFTSYQWGGNMDMKDGAGNIYFNNNMNYGIALSVNTPLETAVQFEYIGQPTNINLTYISDQASHYQTYRVNLHWLQFGMIKRFPINKLVPYVGFSVGTMNMSSKTSEVANKWIFAMSGQVGLKYFISDYIGIRIHSRLLIPVYSGSFEFNIDSDNIEEDVIVLNPSSAVTSLQGDLGVGIIFRLGGI